MWYPESLAAYPQFVIYQVVPSKTRPGKTDKMPINPQTGAMVSAHESANWLTAMQAAKLHADGVGHGIGFVFTEHDPFFFLDIDGALIDGQWSPLATSLCEMFAGCFLEVSQSGTGLHIIGSATPVDHGTRNKEGGLELYTSARFVALTGKHASGDARCVAQDQFNWLAANYFPPSEFSGVQADWTNTPVPEWDGPQNDEELILKMLSSKMSAGAAFGGKASLQDLWNGNVEALGAAYPDEERPFDHNRADAALCQHLAFWTGKDCERMNRLFSQSALYRDKWEDRPDYRHNTITKAAGMCGNVYRMTRAAEPVQPVNAAPADQQPVTNEQAAGMRGGQQILTVAQQLEYFAGCTYIREMHKILTPDGGLLEQGPFRATYGGFTFILDLNGDKDTRNAWEAFTESQGYIFPKVHAACFRPELQAGAIIDEEGQRLVNTYVPIATPRQQGDPGPFLELLGKLLPDPNDRAILLAYLAALVQYPGVKFQWCPLLQGLQGNGKTLIIECATFAVGSRYTHLPAANDISNKFNAWIQNKLFAGVEEIYVADRQEALDALKPLITNRRIDVQGKGADQKTADNRANFILTTNHKDAVRKTHNDRRYCVFFTAQQHARDLERYGMHGDYFPNLYAWLRGGGFAIVNDFLQSYNIPDELNPATKCHRAPVTSTTAEAITASMGGIEQDIQEAIAQGQHGFAGGWISSAAFDRLLKDRKTNITRNRRRSILEEMGYVPHPALKNGRVNNPISEQGIMCKPVLYISEGHINQNIAQPVEVVRFYQAAQQAAPGGMPAVSDQGVTG
jgi:hypothetical protein